MAATLATNLLSRRVVGRTPNGGSRCHSAPQEDLRVLGLASRSEFGVRNGSPNLVLPTLHDTSDKICAQSGGSCGTLQDHHTRRRVCKLLQESDVYLHRGRSQIAAAALLDHQRSQSTCHSHHSTSARHHAPPTAPLTIHPPSHSCTHTGIGVCIDVDIGTYS